MLTLSLLQSYTIMIQLHTVTNAHHEVLGIELKAVSSSPASQTYTNDEAMMISRNINVSNRPNEPADLTTEC